MSDSPKNPREAREADRPAPVILCVDDEVSALSMRNAILTGAGYNVLTASDSFEALDLLTKNPVDLVITDHLLVGASGVSLAKRVKELHSDVPVVILSGVLDKPADVDADQFFLPKSAGPTEMLSQIARLLKL
jgi:two-component system, chemotaxis family, chemotaxis protein CheY